MKEKIYTPDTNTIRGKLLVVALIVALGLGLALTSRVSGAALRQAAGEISGTVTVKGSPTEGLTAELRQHLNDGSEISLATTKTDKAGNYRFSGQPSVPSNGFYYVRFTGGEETLAEWKTWAIIYTSGSQFTVPPVEMGDVKIVTPDASMTLPGKLKWEQRRSGETYRLYVYAQGKSQEKAVKDSGSLGMNTTWDVSAGAIPEGSYDAIVQVRDAVAGWGQSRARFSFSIGKAQADAPPPPPPTVAPKEKATEPSPSEQLPTDKPAAKPDENPVNSTVPTTSDQVVSTGEVSGDIEGTVRADVQLKLSADKTEVNSGEGLVYTIEVANKGGASAERVVVTSQLPKGVEVDSSRLDATAGSVTSEGSTVTARVGDLAPEGKVLVKVPVKVLPEAGTSVSSQASASYAGVTEPVQSNSYSAQVLTAQVTAQPVTGAAPAAPASPPAQIGSSPATGPQAPLEPIPAGKEATVSSEVAGETGAGGGLAAGQVAAPVQIPAEKPVEKPVVKPAEQAKVAEQPRAVPAQPEQPPALKPVVESPKVGAVVKPDTQANVAAAPAKKAPEKSASTMPETGGSFPVVFAFALVLFTLLARYLRGGGYRRA